MQVANTILNQIGNRALTMIGAKNFGALENGVQFKIMRNSKSVQYITVTLNSLDLYDVEFTRVTRNLERIVIAKVDGIYSDMINQVIESKTGLYTSL